MLKYIRTDSWFTQEIVFCCAAGDVCVYSTLDESKW